MPKLSTEHKRFIVQRLACFATPSEVVADVKEQFPGLTVSLHQVIYYDPNTKGTDVAQVWRELHTETRARFVADSSSQAITHANWRLQQLEDMARKAKKSRNFKLAAELLEQAAKDMGGAYRQQQRGVGGAVQTDDEKVEQWKALWTAMETTVPAPVPTGPALVRTIG